MISGELTDNGFKIQIHSDASNKMGNSQDHAFNSSSTKIYNRDVAGFISHLKLTERGNKLLLCNLDPIQHAFGDYFNFTDSQVYDINESTIVRMTSTPSANTNKTNPLCVEGVFEAIRDHFIEFISYINWVQLARFLNYNTYDRTAFDAASMAYMWIETGSRLDIISSLITKENRTITFSDYNGDIAIKVVDKTNVKYKDEPDIPNIIKLTLGEYIKVVMNTKKEWLNMINKAEQNALKAKEAGVVESLEIIALVTKHGWTVEQIDGTSYFTYNKRIVPNKVVESFTNKIYNIPNELKKFYLDKVIVKIGANIGTVKGIGFHPHRQTTGFEISRLSDVCVGDLGGKPITHIIKIPEMLETINVESMWGGCPSLAIGLLFGEDVSQREIRAYGDIIKPFNDNRGIFLKKDIIDTPDGEVFKNKLPVSRAVFEDIGDVIER